MAAPDVDEASGGRESPGDVPLARGEGPGDSRPPLAAPVAAALAGYPISGAAFDELHAADGAPRPHWRPFLDGVAALGLPALAGRWQAGRTLLRQHGASYHAYTDPHDRDRPWPLDPLPLLVSAADHAALAAGLGQRARLFEAVLADLYGPQTLLARGLLPPALVHANPAFLRPCHGLTGPGGRFLHLAAFDIGRGADGRPVVLSDRTQAPAGAGYCLENRLVLARTLPELFHACQVQRLAPFFHALRDGLYALAPRPRETPTAVLLTPGAYNETYFEHALLARYLGLPLVEGSDLTVRNGRVFLKLLDGLQPVDVIWRRLDDDFCDPLELRGDSFLGVPGLVQAARAGHVALANALGSGLVESPALLPYLPTLCRALLGEELLLPSAPTHWCGDPRGLDHVLAHLPTMAIKAAFRPSRRTSVFGDQLDRAGRAALADRLRARPWEYVGQAIVPLSTAPTLEGGRLVARPVLLRTYLTAGPGGAVLIPGGLARVAARADGRGTSMQAGGDSKDTWALSAGPVEAFSLLGPAGQPLALSRGGSDLPSRVADGLFWLGRYAERADGLARLLRGVLVRLTERPGVADVPELPSLLRAVTRVSGTYPGFHDDANLRAPAAELHALLFDPDRVGGLAYDLHTAVRLAGTVRDRIATDMWRGLSRLAERDAPPADPPALSDWLDRLDRAVLGLAGFAGLAAESMTRGHGWRFLHLGRALERAQHTVGLLHACAVTPGPAEAALLEAVLEVADAGLTYRRRYLAGPQAAPVLDLLLADDTNPRSVLAQLDALRDLVDPLPRPPTAAGPAPAQRQLLALRTALQLADLQRLAGPAAGTPRVELAAFLAGLEHGLPALAEALTTCYLTHLQPARQFVTGG